MAAVGASVVVVVVVAFVVVVVNAFDVVADTFVVAWALTGVGGTYAVVVVVVVVETSSSSFAVDVVVASHR